MRFFRTREPAWRREQRALIASLLKSKSITSAEVEAAFRALPRHEFITQYYNRDGVRIRVNPKLLTAEQAADLYEDRAITTYMEEGELMSSTTQPSLMATMIEALALRRGMKVLEIGAGTGWNAALMANIVSAEGRVVSVDVLPEAVESARASLQRLKISNVSVVEGDGGIGLAAQAPYDRVVVTAASPCVPRAWRDQLRDGGLLLVNLQTKGARTWSDLILFEKQGEILRGRIICLTSFIHMRGALESHDEVFTSSDEMETPGAEFALPWAAADFLAAHRDAALNDFLLYLVLQGFRVEERDRKHIVTHREFHGSALMLIERAEMRGQPAFAGRFLRAMDDWVALDAPRLSDWIVEMDNYTKVEHRGMEIQLGDEFMQFRLGD